MVSEDEEVEVVVFVSNQVFFRIHRGGALFELGRGKGEGRTREGKRDGETQR